MKEHHLQIRDCPVPCLITGGYWVWKFFGWDRDVFCEGKQRDHTSGRTNLLASFWTIDYSRWATYYTMYIWCDWLNMFDAHSWMCYRSQTMKKDIGPEKSHRHPSPWYSTTPQWSQICDFIPYLFMGGVWYWGKDEVTVACLLSRFRSHLRWVKLPEKDHADVMGEGEHHEPIQPIHGLDVGFTHVLPPWK